MPLILSNKYLSPINNTLKIRITKATNPPAIAMERRVDPRSKSVREAISNYNPLNNFKVISSF